jgi:hypothetical protein
LREKSLVGTEFVQTLLVDAAESQAGIVPGFFPQVGIQRGEEFDGGMVPGPPQVQGKLVQALETSRQARCDMIGVDSGHLRDLSGFVPA